jgi:hypothetical protein
MSGGACCAPRSQAPPGNAFLEALPPDKIPHVHGYGLTIFAIPALAGQSPWCRGATRQSLVTRNTARGSERSVLKMRGEVSQ